MNETKRSLHVRKRSIFTLWKTTKVILTITVFFTSKRRFKSTFTTRWRFVYLAQVARGFHVDITYSRLHPLWTGNTHQNKLSDTVGWARTTKPCGQEFDSRSGYTGDLQYGTYVLVLHGARHWRVVARKLFTCGPAIDMPPVQHLLRKQPPSLHGVFRRT